MQNTTLNRQQLATLLKQTGRRLPDINAMMRHALYCLWVWERFELNGEQITPSEVSTMLSEPFPQTQEQFR